MANLSTDAMLRFLRTEQRKLDQRRLEIKRRMAEEQKELDAIDQRLYDIDSSISYLSSERH